MAYSQRQPEELQRMSLLEHLEELRKRILWSLLALAVAFVPCWIYVKQIFRFLQVPLWRIDPNLKLVFMGLTDPFILYFKVAALTALFVASPFVLYQVWAFVAPGLYRRERSLALPFVFFTTVFFISGGAFGYYVAFPYAARFLLGIGEGFQALPEIGKYFGFLLTVLLGLGLMFELPIFILLLSLIGVVTPRFLLRYFRHAVVVIFIVAAVITPTPDVVNLCIMAVPALGLYLLGIGAAFLAAYFRKKRQAEMTAEFE
ncbi:MAG TPA: twin-arginine translocase subunit TatC [Thermoanaerobaculia bacterium]|jgi:sec-independent protein translocase protein TatC|nr:twin-arginine translocase subunit TatC [Thermoanaerobaculia bacterium]